jgi:aryl-alcohol dehydrogenase-like predicted oxidoreductase
MSQETESASVSRLALGTAQFGQPYGVANTCGQLAPHAVAAILELAAGQGVDTLDTAIAYGGSEAALGAAGVSAWRVISKLPALPGGTGDITGWVREQVQGSLARLRVTQLDGLLLHRPADLLGPYGASLRDSLAGLKAAGLIAAAGVSIYDPRELD